MQKFIGVLFKIDSLLSNWVAQTALLVLNLWGIQLKDSWFSIWIAIGLVCYCYLMYTDLKNDPAHQAEMKKTYQEHGPLPFLKGFNYSLFLGPLSVALRLLLSKDKSPE